MEVKCLLGDEGCAYYTKGHVAPDVFLDALRKEVEVGDPILKVISIYGRQ